MQKKNLERSSSFCFVFLLDFMRGNFIIFRPFTEGCSQQQTHWMLTSMFCHVIVVNTPFSAHITLYYDDDRFYSAAMCPFSCRMFFALDNGTMSDDSFGHWGICVCIVCVETLWNSGRCWNFIIWKVSLKRADGGYECEKSVCIFINSQSDDSGSVNFSSGYMLNAFTA